MTAEGEGKKKTPNKLPPLRISLHSVFKKGGFFWVNFFSRGVRFGVIFFEGGVADEQISAEYVKPN